MMKRIFSLTVGMFTSLVFSSCGGGSSGGSCANSAACGGNIAGSWTIQSSCITANASMFDDTCPTATVSTSNLKMTGTVTYKTDMTYTSSTSTSGSVTVYVPSSCLTSGGVTVTCDQLNQAYEADPTEGLTLQCTGTSDCTCIETETNAASSTSGTYTTTAAGLLTETSSDGSVDETDFCVKGSTLTESPHAGSAMMGQNVSGTITATKS